MCQILVAQLPDWREASVLQRPSLPRYVDVDWRVDVKTASDRVSRIAVPCCLVDIKVQDQPTSTSQVPATRQVEFELSKEALQTMLDGLGRIRDQLGAVAGNK
jgi:COMM domain containing 9